MRAINWQRMIMALIVLLAFMMEAAMAARSPLGIGVAEQAFNPSSPFATIFLKIQGWQMQFERAIQQILVAMREDSEGMIWLVGLSFLYGILHAAGPGHGKAVITAYLVADQASLRRGVLLSFFSSILQALSAICIILAIFLFLPGQLTQTTHFVIILSYVLVTLVGLWLLVRHSLRLIRRKKPAANLDALFDGAPAHPPVAILSSGLSTSTTREESRPGLAWRRDNNASLAGAAFSGWRNICRECGQMHLIDADHLQQKLRLKTALSLIFATGLRPCNGALFVMSFALLNRLETIGIVAVFAMAFGTFITVSCLASLAVYARNLALALSSRRKGTKQAAGKIKSFVEWGASLFIFVTGIVLLAASYI